MLRSAYESARSASVQRGGHQLPPPAAVVVVEPGVEVPGAVVVVVAAGGAGRGFMACSMTARAMGAATRPPVDSLLPLWPSTMTATAIVGACPTGPAKQMTQAWDRSGAVPYWAVPV